MSPNDKILIDTTVLYLLNLLPTAIIEIGSHTDNIGKKEFNLKLSQKRADAVVRYLVSKGILEKRLFSRGYGMSQPVADNQNPDGSDNPEGRRKNRRTQIKIIGTLAPDENVEE
jgi:outer membrane protein OmpA-like peptidoglycan-associated protein